MEKSTKIGIGIFALLVIGGVFMASLNDNPSVTANVVNAEGGMRHVQIDAKRFDFGPEVRVKQGENIMLMINNMDTTHGIRIPELGVSGNDMVTFTADKKGEFEFYCNTYCGEGHMGMTGKIIVE